MTNANVPDAVSSIWADYAAMNAYVAELEPTISIASIMLGFLLIISVPGILEAHGILQKGRGEIVGLFWGAGFLLIPLILIASGINLPHHWFVSHEAYGLEEPVFPGDLVRELRASCAATRDTVNSGRIRNDKLVEVVEFYVERGCDPASMSTKLLARSSTGEDGVPKAVLDALNAGS